VEQRKTNGRRVSDIKLGQELLPEFSHSIALKMETQIDQLIKQNSALALEVERLTKETQSLLELVEEFNSIMGATKPLYSGRGNLC
jgi:hypothetical protein